MRIIALEEHFTLPSGDRTPPGSHPGNDREVITGVPTAAALLDLGAGRLAAMDEAGIDMQVLSLNQPGCQLLEGDAALATAIEANDHLAAAVRRHPDRFAGFAAIPSFDPGAGALELRRCVVELGFGGGVINGHSRGRFLDDPHFWPIFEAAHELGVPIYLHPSTPHPGAMAAYFKGYEELAYAAWGFALDTCSHFMRLVFAGVFDRYPRLKIILGHLGEGLPFWLHRANDHTRLAAARRGLKKDLAGYLRENLVVTCSGNFSVPAMLCTIMALGIDNVMFAVDWPYETNRDGVAFLKSLPIGPADMEKIAGRNAGILLGLPDGRSGAGRGTAS